MSLQSPLARVLGRGPAKEGTHHWWLQRVTSIALVPLTLWFVISLFGLPSFEHASVMAWMHEAWTATWLVLLVLVVARHSELGVRVVVEDYVHGAAKTTLLILSGFAHVVVVAVAVFAVLKVAFGGVTS